MLPSIIRTVVPIVVGLVLSAPLVSGWDIDAGALEVVVTGAVTGAYYTVVRLLEEHVAPRFGWLLGLANRPAYDVID